jgi:hypothetical protein
MIDFKAIKFFGFAPLNFREIKPNILVQNYASINLLPNYKKLPKLNILPQLNIFYQIKISEPDHSAILANLLSPQGTHSCNDVFLKLFFKIFVPEMEIDDNEYWTVTAEAERYDIRIKNQDNSKIIIIENKSNNAQDQQNQLYRYWFYGIYMPQFNRKTNGLKCFAKVIYLSPSDYKQPEAQSFSRPNYMDKNLPEKVPQELMKTTFFNDQITKWLNCCIETIDNNTNVYYYLTQYKDFWR